MFNLIRFSPSDHIVGKYNCTHPSQCCTPELVIPAEPALSIISRGTGMPMGAEDCRPRRIVIERTVQVAGDVKSGNRLKGNIFNRVAIMQSRRTMMSIELRLPRQRCKSEGVQDVSSYRRCTCSPLTA